MITVYWSVVWVKYKTIVVSTYITVNIKALFKQLLFTKIFYTKIYIGIKL